MILSFLVALLIAFMTIAFAARIVGALFSSKSRKLIRENKIWHFVWFLQFALVMFLLSTGLPEPRISPARWRAKIAVSSLQQLHLALQQYNLDNINNDAKPSRLYPHTLHDLVTSGYLSENDFKRLTAGMPIVYYEPPPDSSGTFLLLEVSTPDYYAAITLDGTTQSQVYKKDKKAEQARAVNRWPVRSFDEHRFDIPPLRHRACWQKSRPSAFAPDAFDPPAAPASDT